ncbi:MAG: EAL domain-containing protein [Acidiferrobacterales bacterium]
MDKKLLHVLIIDDSPDDAALVVETLRRAGYIPKSQRVQDIVGMQSALAKEAWDVVIAETDVPYVTIPAALDALRHARHEPPCIVMTRTVSDEDMAGLMAAGVRDIVFKHQTSRLAPVIEREIAVGHARVELEETRQALAQLQQRYQVLVDGSHDAICYSQDGMHTSANPAYLKLFGYDDVKELEEIPVLNLVDKTDHTRLKEQFRKAGRDPQGVRVGELTAMRKDGTRFPADFTISSISMEGGNWHQIRVNDISHQKSIESRLQYLHDHDAATGLYNRQYFLQALGEAISAAKTGTQTGIVMHLDLNQLREINDAYGYGAGDRMIAGLAQLLREKPHAGDVLARLGGDEFAVLLPDTADRPAMEGVAEISRILGEATFTEDGRTFSYRCDIGTAVVDGAAGGPEQVLALACRMHAPEQPKPAAPVAVADATPGEVRPSATVHRIERAGSIAKSIETALRTDGFRLLYQPIVSLQGDPLENYEVLVRMSAGGTDLIAAADFMPTAEEAQFTRDIDRFVVRRAIGTLRDLRAAGRQLSLFVNLSVAAVTDKELPIMILDALRDTGVKGGSLVFEINESILAEHPRDASAFISALRKLGCRFAADEFGRQPETTPLQQPFDYVKIDNAFVHSLIDRDAGSAVVKELFDAANDGNRRVIVKNVEDAASLAVLWNFGIEYVQGNYFQPPDSALNYNFAGETIDSDQATASWMRPDR